jgi:hypothetical protein
MELVLFSAPYSCRAELPGKAAGKFLPLLREGYYFYLHVFFLHRIS